MADITTPTPTPTQFQPIENIGKNKSTGGNASRSADSIKSQSKKTEQSNLSPKSRLIVSTDLEAIDTTNIILLSGTSSSTNNFSAIPSGTVVSILDFMRQEKESRLPISSSKSTILSVSNINNSDINSLSSDNVDPVNSSKYAQTLSILPLDEINNLRRTHESAIAGETKELADISLRLNNQIKKPAFSWGSFKAGAQTLLNTTIDKSIEEYKVIADNTVNSVGGKANSLKKSGKQFWKDIKTSPETIKKLFGINTESSGAPIDANAAIRKLASRLSISDVEANKRFGSTLNKMKQNSDKSNNDKVANKTSDAATKTQTTVVKNYKNKQKKERNLETLKEELKLIDQEIAFRKTKF